MLPGHVRQHAARLAARLLKDAETCHDAELCPGWDVANGRAGSAPASW
jgi:hypothetical protein